MINSLLGGWIKLEHQLSEREDTCFKLRQEIMQNNLRDVEHFKIFTLQTWGDGITGEFHVHSSQMFDST